MASQPREGGLWPPSLPASPAAGTPALSPAIRDGSRMAVKRCKYPHRQQTALPNGKPARSQARPPFEPGVLFPRIQGGRASLPGPAGPRDHSRCGRTYLPSPRLRGRRQSHRPKPCRRRPPPPRSSRCSPGDSLYLRVSQPQNGAEGGNQAPAASPAPHRVRPAPSAPPIPRPWPTHPRRASPAPPRSPRRAPQARRGEGRPAGPAGAPRRGEAAAPRRRTETVRGGPHLPRRGSASSAGLGRESGRREGRAREVGGHPRGISGRQPLPDKLGGATCGCSAAWAEESEPTSA